MEHKQGPFGRRITSACFATLCSLTLLVGCGGVGEGASQKVESEPAVAMVVAEQDSAFVDCGCYNYCDNNSTPSQFIMCLERCLRECPMPK